MMKKTNSMRVAAAMLALTLITSCFVGGTFAKYTTGASGGDSARVAKFGVKVEGPGEVFKAKYATDDTETLKGAFSVSSKNQKDKVVAPGTKGTINLFTISGTPEVAVKIKASMTNVKSVYLKYKQTEIGFTADVSDWEDGEIIDLPITFSDDALTYNPINWTLKRNGVEVDSLADNGSATLEQIAAWLNTNINGKVYEPNTILDNVIGGTYTLEWEWPFNVNDGETDFLDTVLGDLQAGKISYNTDHNLTEAFDFSITVTQID